MFQIKIDKNVLEIFPEDKQLLYQKSFLIKERLHKKTTDFIMEKLKGVSVGKRVS